MNKTKTLTFIALLSALAIVFTMIEITYPFAPWLKFDLSEIAILFATNLLGLIPAIITSCVKAFLQLFTGDSTPYNIGEITALIASMTFAISFYITRKKSLLSRMIIVATSFTVVMITLNFFLITPIFFTGSLNFQDVIKTGMEVEIFNISVKVIDTASYLKMIILIYLPFNLIKSSLICIIYSFIQKPIHKAFELIVNTNIAN
ncbi:MAG: ECF transporter S component [Bacilli bacterium]